MNGRAELSSGVVLVQTQMATEKLLRCVRTGIVFVSSTVKSAVSLTSEHSGLVLSRSIAVRADEQTPKGVTVWSQHHGERNCAVHKKGRCFCAMAILRCHLASSRTAQATLLHSVNRTFTGYGAFWVVLTAGSGKGKT